MDKLLTGAIINGQTTKEFTVREFTGNEEMLVLDKKLQANPARLITKLLVACVTSIGTLTPKNENWEQYFKSLSLADRDILLFAVASKTYKGVVKKNCLCYNPKCVHSNVESMLEVTFNLEADMEATPAVGFEFDAKGRSVKTLNLKCGHTAVVTILTGEMQEKMGEFVRSEDYAQLTKLYTCASVVSIDGQNVMFDDVMKQPLPVLQEIRASIEKDMPKFKLKNTSIKCPECDSPIQLTLQLVDFFV